MPTPTKQITVTKSKTVFMRIHGVPLLESPSISCHDFRIAPFVLCRQIGRHRRHADFRFDDVLSQILSSRVVGSFTRQWLRFFTQNLEKYPARGGADEKDVVGLLGRDLVEEI